MEECNRTFIHKLKSTSLLSRWSWALALGMFQHLKKTSYETCSWPVESPAYIFPPALHKENPVVLVLPSCSLPSCWREQEGDGVRHASPLTCSKSSFQCTKSFCYCFEITAGRLELTTCFPHPLCAILQNLQATSARVRQFYLPQTCLSDDVKVHRSFKIK